MGLIVIIQSLTDAVPSVSAIAYAKGDASGYTRLETIYSPDRCAISVRDSPAMVYI